MKTFRKLFVGGQDSSSAILEELLGGNKPGKHRAVTL